MKFFWSSVILICLLAGLTNCSNSGNNTDKTIRFPNNDSELTILMREMYDYYDILKSEIEKGEVPDKIREFKEIHNAVATDPSKSESPLYKAMSTVYLESAERLNLKDQNIRETFNIMIDNCMNCHKQMCPGPMVKIKKLYVSTN